ncbi:GTP 3',8-cyclase MoaA [Thermomicrobium sp. 4228-Ro]|uniref:GTP 3',8-cyclase MoaA n=1 Tax=Thermomicrobium sp. 4228-Ro TaxID=2993937 RepID=UPI002248F5E5|nr:GTP 3',8-cyclase MoaA [Thermomicrobium sp. 4228-Ro]MCX2727684.1 GTP 3',8-cyclase MoaA [Thermomicrobium sp. 4228-Ro]
MAVPVMQRAIAGDERAVPRAGERITRDAYGRPITYLRISLTDRCNLRCVYCMPAHGMKFAPREELLTDEELLRIVRVAAQVGFSRLRLTGGEPTVRPNVVELVRAMAQIPGVEDISMTTNGLLLERLAYDLAAAGLKRINVSLDTLDPQRYRIITRGGRIEKVWAGIAAAEDAGLSPIKLNAVVVRGFNDDEVPALAGLTLERSWQVRFIEVMPLEGVAEVHDTGLVTTAETRARIEAVYGPLEQLEAPLSDPARVYRIPGAKGTIGFISPVSEPFCAFCNRIRLTADGKLRLCLLRADEVDIRGLVRSGASDEALMERIRAAVWRKPWGHGLREGDRRTGRGMSQIGG